MRDFKFISIVLASLMVFGEVGVCLGPLKHFEPGDERAQPEDALSPPRENDVLVPLRGLIYDVSRDDVRDHSERAKFSEVFDDLMGRAGPAAWDYLTDHAKSNPQFAAKVFAINMGRGRLPDGSSWLEKFFKAIPENQKEEVWSHLSEGTMLGPLRELARQRGISEFAVLDFMFYESVSMETIITKKQAADALEFTMGEENRTHQVRLTKPYDMEATPVTQFFYFLVTGKNPSRFKTGKGIVKFGVDAEGKDVFGYPNRPVEMVSWNDAKDFLKKLNELDPNSPYRYRLPTAAEWEYAAKGGTTHNDHVDGWHAENSGLRTHDVGEKPSNRFGLYDMHGNVWEWVEDWYEPYPLSPVTDPTGPTNGSFRVLRGGSYFYDASSLRSAERLYGGPLYRNPNFGFRFVRELK